MSLGELFDAAAASLDAVDRRESERLIEFLIDGRPFAALADGTAEFRLGPQVARAALGTPDAARSARGPDWVAFRPLELDRFARDRATAWFLSAWRYSRS